MLYFIRRSSVLILIKYFRGQNGGIKMQFGNLTLSMLGKQISRRCFEIVSYSTQKASFDISCKLSPKGTIFWIHNKKKISSVCPLITKTRLFKYIENFTSKNIKFSDKKIGYFSYFCSKHRLWVLVRTASARRF